MAEKENAGVEAKKISVYRKICLKEVKLKIGVLFIFFILSFAFGWFLGLKKTTSESSLKPSVFFPQVGLPEPGISPPVAPILPKVEIPKLTFPLRPPQIPQIKPPVIKPFTPPPLPPQLKKEKIKSKE